MLICWGWSCAHWIQIAAKQPFCFFQILTEGVAGILSSAKVCCKDDKLASFQHKYMSLGKFSANG